MTAINVAVDADKIVIATDSVSVCPSGQRSCRNKCLVDTHARLAIAHCGLYGMSLQFDIAMLCGVLGNSLSDVLNNAPPLLRSHWKSTEESRPAGVPSGLFFAGANGKNRVAAYIASSYDNFEPRLLHAGYLWLMPGLRSLREAESKNTFELGAKQMSGPAEFFPNQTPAAGPTPWSERLTRTVTRMRDQQRENPGMIGGAIVRTYVCADYIDQRIIDQLPPKDPQ